MNRTVLSMAVVLFAVLVGCRGGGAKKAEDRPPSIASPAPQSSTHLMPEATATTAAPSSVSATTNVTPQAPTPPRPTEPPTPGFKELFPGVRVDVAHKIVEFDGEIAIDCHNPQTPRVYLEVLVCSPDTREHESIVVTRAKPSLVHAALLAVGFKDGKPGSWEWDEANKTLISIPPTGDPLRVELVILGVARDLAEFAVRADTKAALNKPSSQGKVASTFLFAGSTLRTRAGTERYEADGAGTLVGITTFGTETIAWSRLHSPDASIEEPTWIANVSLVPARGTKVVIRVSPGPPAAP